MSDLALGVRVDLRSAGTRRHYTDLGYIVIWSVAANTIQRKVKLVGVYWSFRSGFSAIFSIKSQSYLPLTS